MALAFDVIFYVVLCKIRDAQSCPTLCDPMDCSPPDSSVHGILQARILEWVAISFSRGSSQPRDWTRVSCICRQMLYPLSHQGSPNRRLALLITWTYMSCFSIKVEFGILLFITPFSLFGNLILAILEDIVGLVPDHCNKVSHSNFFG